MKSDAMRNSKHFQIFVVVGALLPLLIAADTPEEAVQKVRAGLKFFRSSQFSEAETAFSEASELAPENATIHFDNACAAMAGGDVDQARNLFRKASAAKDAVLGIKANYNLGCLEADQAREKLGEDPAAATGHAREESIKLLLTSVRHYRDVLRLDRNHKEARHNLELIRLFIKHIQSQWAERDKQQARQEKDLLQFLKMIEDRETAARTATRLLRDEKSTAHVRQAVRETADQLRTLQEETDPLKQKIKEQIQASMQGQSQTPNSGQNAVSDEQMQQAEKALLDMADGAGEGMLTAADSLESGEFDQAVSAETESLDRLNQLFVNLAPYQNVLQRALQQQQSIAPEEIEQDEDSRPESELPPEDATSEEASDGSEEVSKLVTELEAEQQIRVTEWSGVLSMKAELELPGVQQQLQALQQNADSAQPSEEEKTEDDKDDKDDEDKPKSELTEEERAAAAQQEQMKQQLKQAEGLVKSMELAMKLGPKAAEHSAAAAGFLQEGASDAANPEQTETLRILKQIAEPLKNENDQQDQNQDQNQDENQNDDQDQSQQDDQQQDDKQQDQEEQKPEQNQEQQEKQSKQQQAESVLRQARERERKHREDMKKIRALLGRGSVDKDW